MPQTGISCHETVNKTRSVPREAHFGNGIYINTTAVPQDGSFGHGMRADWQA